MFSYMKQIHKNSKIKSQTQCSDLTAGLKVCIWALLFRTCFTFSSLLYMILILRCIRKWSMVLSLMLVFLIHFIVITAQKWSFPLRISSVNLTKFAGKCGFGHITGEILIGKPHFYAVDTNWLKLMKNKIVEIWEKKQKLIEFKSRKGLANFSS